MLDRLLNPDAVCPVTAALLESASRNHEKWERQLMPGPPQRAGKTGTLKRKLLIMETVIRKYAPEALRTAKRNTAAKMLTDEPDLVRAANLAEEISGILWVETAGSDRHHIWNKKGIASTTCWDAAQIVKHQEATEEENKKFGEYAGRTLAHWGRAQGLRIETEASRLIEELSRLR